MPSLLIFIKLIGIGVILAGWGFLATEIIQRLVRLDASRFGWFELAVLGTVAAYVYAAMAALFLPLAGAVTVLFVLTGMAGFILAVVVRRRPPCPWVLGFGLAIALLTAVGTVQTPLNYDAGLYYLQHVKHLESNGLVLGLANVHSRLGFNSAVVSLSSIFHGSVFGQDGLFLVGPALFLVFAGAMFEYAASGLRRGDIDGGHLTALFCLAWWLIAFNETVLSWFGLSPSGDLVAAAATSYCPVAMLGLCRAAANKDREAYERYALLLPSVVAFAIIAKLSVAPVALFLILSWSVLRTELKGGLGLRAPITGMACFAAIISLWLLHNLLASGCLLYPVSSSCVTWLPWTADKGQVTFASDSIRSWARAPDAPVEWALKGWNWLGPWQEKMLPNRQFVFTLLKGLPVVLVLALGVRFGFRASLSNGRLAVRTLLGALTINLIGLASWFLLAPDPRFGLGFMLGALATSAALIAVSGAGYTFDRVRARRFSTIVCGVFVAVILNDARMLMALPVSPRLMPWRSLPVPLLRYMANREGLRIAVPLDGDQCWNTETLCTPEVAPKLARTKILGRTAFTVHGDSVLTNVGTASKGPAVSSSEPRFKFSPAVAGEEATTQGGSNYSVRWLQQRSEFVIQHEGPPRKVHIEFRVATYQVERRVWLEQEGQPLPAREVVRKSFWEGGAVSVANTAMLSAGVNHFAIATDGSAVDVTPGRPVFLLLVNGIDISSSPESK